MDRKRGKKSNSTPKQLEFKAYLESKGETNVEVWWEPLMPATEMCGVGGGIVVQTDQQGLLYLGTTYVEACHNFDETVKYSTPVKDYLDMPKTSYWVRLKQFFSIWGVRKAQGGSMPKKG